VALSTINDAVLRVGELLIPIVDVMKRDLLAGDYIQADETYVGVQTPDKKGENHTGILSGSTARRARAWSSTSR
jgi:transposase